MTAGDLCDFGHDYGRGHGVHTPLAQGETQVCRLCGLTRWLASTGKLSVRYGRLRRNR